MIAVVTGTSGFIGSHVVQALLQRGATVRALVRPQSGVAKRVADVSYFEVDVLSGQAVRQTKVWDGATHLFHVAGLTTARNLAEFRKGNVEPLQNILSALVERNAMPRVVVVSSQAAAGPARNALTPVRESDTPQPIEAYGQSKLESEQCAADFAPRIPIAIVRPPAVYGPGDRDFLAAFRQALQPVALYAIRPEYQLDIVHVSDVVRALLLAGEHPDAVGRVYFVSGDQPTSWRDLYAEIGRAAGVRSRALVVPSFALRLAALAGDAAGLVTNRTPLINSQKLELARAPFWLCDSRRIRQELQWKPQTTLRDGVRDTYNWYLAAGWLKKRSRASDGSGKASRN